MVEETYEKAELEHKKIAENEGLQVEAMPLGSFLDSATAHERIATGFQELDRVFGGGLVPGSLLLLGGEPGIGKSTLLLQLIGNLAKKNQKVLYVSGEESGPQVAARAARLGISKEAPIEFVSTNSMSVLKSAVKKIKPQVLVVDSVQTIADDVLESAAGTVSQVREVTQSCLTLSKGQGITTFLIGHLTKEGSLAGPKLLEHMVDGVFYFEQASNGNFRLLRAQKNRFGATHELAVFEMGTKGLAEILNPSERFLMERAHDAPGNALVAPLEGTRSFLTEVQALTQKCYFGHPARTVQGVDRNRVAVLLAVAEKVLQISFGDSDVFVKVASGAKVEEPASDLAILFAMASAATQKIIPGDWLMLGEVGLSGEVRSVAGLASRLLEAQRVGVRHAVIPSYSLKEVRGETSLELHPVKNIKEAWNLIPHRQNH